MNAENKDVEIIQSSETALSLITKAEIDVQISTAKAFPRSIKTFLEKAESIATVSEEVAQSCSYSLPRGGKALEGPTVRLAEIVCSTYGNIRSGARVIANDGKTITAQGVCHDLETNNSVTVEVKRRITDRNGKTFNEDMQTVTGNAACAIAYRNAVFKVIPSALVSEVYNKTKLVARGTAETLPARRAKAIEYLKTLKVTEKQILDVLELKKIEDIDLDKLSILRGMCSLIKNGESTASDLFSPGPESNIPPLEDLQALLDLKKEALNKVEIENASRIIENKEKESYTKLFNLLKSK